MDSMVLVRPGEAGQGSELREAARPGAPPTAKRSVLGSPAPARVPTPAHSHRSGAHGSRETVGPRICGDTSTLSGSWGPQGQPPAPVLCSCTALG